MDLRKWQSLALTHSLTNWLTGHQNLSGTSCHSRIIKFCMLVEFGVITKEKFQKPKLSLFQLLWRLFGKLSSIICLWNESMILWFGIMVEFGVIIKEKYEKPKLSRFQLLKWREKLVGQIFIIFKYVMSLGC